MAIGVAVIGCGLVGARRARAVADHPLTSLRVVVDTNHTRADVLGHEYNCAIASTWSEVSTRSDIDAVIVSTPNALLEPIGCAALERGLHVLIEKPMGRNASEAERLAAAARAHGRVLKVGFNHRYHPALAMAHQLFSAGTIGHLIQLRARYGHGSRPGCERDWRADPQLAGGGELTDQGVHIIDLFQWFAGIPERVHAEVQSAVWRRGALEDNAFATMRYPRNVVGQFHVSMTQWRNLFSFEVHGELGALVVEGLGGSYGVETLRLERRNPGGGPPSTETVQFEGEDASWRSEWDDFAAAVQGAPLRHGTPQDGIAVMRTLAALYAAARSTESATAPLRALQVQ